LASTRKRAWTILANHWFVIALVMVLLIGFAGADLLAPLNRYAWPRTIMVCFVMGLMALPIPFELIRKSLAKPWPAFLASMINMLVVPLLAWIAALALPLYLGGGLIVAATIPCTLASAAVWTRRAGGDDTVAILVTLITNLLCVVVTPLWLVLLLGRSVRIEVAPLMQELILVVLLPIIVAQCLRTNASVAHWSERHKLSLAVVCQLGILAMVMSGAIQMGQRLQTPGVDVAHMPTTASSVPALASSITVWQVIWTVLLASAVHLVAMAIGWYGAASSYVARPQQIGVAISGSQKTLMIGLKMAMDCGVSIIPMVAFHVCQLLLDTFIADRWRKSSLRDEEAQASAP
jgi:sodium/bile acid cotransporter 7